MNGTLFPLAVFRRRNDQCSRRDAVSLAWSRFRLLDSQSVLEGLGDISMLGESRGGACGVLLGSIQDGGVVTGSSPCTVVRGAGHGPGSAEGSDFSGGGWRGRHAIRPRAKPIRSSLSDDRYPVGGYHRALACAHVGKVNTGSPMFFTGE